MSDLQELPANQMALAKTFSTLAKGRRKSLKWHLAQAETVMNELRERGFRLVPFPPLKSIKPVRKARKPSAARKAA